MATNLDAVVNNVKQQLRDEFDKTAGEDFPRDELEVIIRNTLVELSSASPYRAIEPVLTVANSKLLDIGGVADLIIVEAVEYPVGQNPRTYHNFNKIDNDTIEVSMSSNFSNTGTGSTLTGTITFTSGSPTVTGSGSLFTTELAAGYFIKKSNGVRWYRIYSVESATSLTLEEAVKSADNGADTVSVTQYRDYAARVTCRKVHTLTVDTSTLNPAEEGCLIIGATGKAANNWINKFRPLIDNSINLLTETHSSIDDMEARLARAIQDINDSRDSIGTVAWRNPVGEYLASAGQELQAASVALAKSSGYIREGQSNLNIGRVVQEYQRWANQQLSEFREKLRKLAQDNRRTTEELAQ